MFDLPKVYIVDAHNLLYKAHFALLTRPLINSKGRDVSVCFAFTRMLLGLIKEKKPQYLAMAFDRKAPTFRHQLYEQYKLHRPPMPAPIADNLPDIKRIVSYLGIRILEQDGYEADDILGTSVNALKNKSVELIIITSDKDMLQLVESNVHVLAAKKGLSEFVEYRREEVFEKYGVFPDKMIDFFSIMGDKIDNVPGIPGIGPKGAAKLLTQFDSLEDILNNLSKIESEKLRQRIAENEAFALLSKKLITLKLDADVPEDLESYRILPRDDAKLRALFSELEFRSMISDLGPVSDASEKRNYQIIDNRIDLVELVRRIRAEKEFAFDVETTSIDPMTGKLVGISISFKPLEAYYLPLGHKTSQKQLSLDDIQSVLMPILIDPNICKIGQNIKYDWIISRCSGLDLKGVSFDTMVGSHLLNPGLHQHNLDNLCMDYLNLQKIPTDSLIGSNSPYPTMDLVPIEKTSQYACEDADTTLRLYRVLQPKLVEHQLEKLMTSIEVPLIEVLVDMEMNGIRIDTDLLNKLSMDVGILLENAAEDIHIMAGESFNINSPAQLSKILFEKLHYPVKGIKKTKSGYSTAESELKKLAAQGGLFQDLPFRILEYRSLSKLKGTYLDTLPTMVNSQTGRVHTSFNQTVAETGRLSSSNPNLQNIPIRSEIGKRVREAFIPSDGNLMLSADYSQMELRILAHIARDQAMSEAFKNGQDIHAATAAKLFNVKLDKVTSEQRRRAKTVNFGIDYGMTPFGLSERLGISVREAKKYIDSYLEEFSGVKKYIQMIQDEVQKNGYVSTLSGRRRYIPMARDERKQIREAGFRQAINMPIQGTAADIIKIAMISVYREFRSAGLKSKMILQIHDELLFDVVPEEKALVEDMVRNCMESAWSLDVPLIADLNFGSNWAEIH